jgi:hypothetical protein
LFTPISGYERETTINFSDGDQTAIIYTCNKAMIRKLDKFCLKYPSVYQLLRQDEYSKTYQTIKKYISIRAPKSNKGNSTALENYRKIKSTVKS